MLREQGLTISLGLLANSTTSHNLLNEMIDAQGQKKFVTKYIVLATPLDQCCDRQAPGVLQSSWRSDECSWRHITWTPASLATILEHLLIDCAQRLERHLSDIKSPDTLAVEVEWL